MVTRETSYIGQLYFGLSTDDPSDVPAWHNGDRILVMDQDQMLVFDEVANNFHPISMGGGGGGYVKELMATGTYTSTTATTTLTIPITTIDSSLVKMASVVVTAPIASTAQGYAAFTYYTSGSDPDEFSDNNVHLSTVRARKADNSFVFLKSYPSALGIGDTTITAQIQDGSYQWKANTYEYKIYQEVPA